MFLQLLQLILDILAQSKKLKVKKNVAMSAGVMHAPQYTPTAPKDQLTNGTAVMTGRRMREQEKTTRSASALRKLMRNQGCSCLQASIMLGGKVTPSRSKADPT